MHDEKAEKEISKKKLLKENFLVETFLEKFFWIFLVQKIKISRKFYFQVHQEKLEKFWTLDKIQTIQILELNSVSKGLFGNVSFHNHDLEKFFPNSWENFSLFSFFWILLMKWKEFWRKKLYFNEVPGGWEGFSVLLRTQ